GASGALLRGRAEHFMLRPPSAVFVSGSYVPSGCKSRHPAPKHTPAPRNHTLKRHRLPEEVASRPSRGGLFMRRRLPTGLTVGRVASGCTTELPTRKTPSPPPICTAKRHHPPLRQANPATHAPPGLRPLDIAC